MCATIVFAQTITHEDYNILANDGDDNDYYGTCVSLFDNVAVVGAPNYDDATNGTDAGAVYIYNYNSFTDEWDYNTTLTALDGNAYDEFGRQVCIYKNDIIIVGAHKHTHTSLSQAGAVYIFKKDILGDWNQTKITPADAAANDHFGRAVSIWYPYAIIGALDKDDEGANAGAAYIYKYNTITDVWDLDQQIFGSTIGAGDNFGQSVEICRSTAVIGAMYDDDNGYNAGAAYVFNRGSLWYQKAKLLADDGSANDWFSNSVSVWISRDRGIEIAVGAMNEDEEGNNAGAAYIFNYTTNGFTQTEKITCAYAGTGDFFSVTALVDDYLVIGSYSNNTNGTDAGIADLWQYDPLNGWEYEHSLQPDNVAAGDWFGRGTGLSGRQVIVGAARDHNANGNDAGEAYIFNLPSANDSKISSNNLTIDPSEGKNSDISIFPNPCNNTISISTEMEITSVNIIDITGKIVKTISDMSINQDIDLSDLNAGMYIIGIKYSQGYSYQQIVKK